MKYALITLCALAFAGCETTNPDGSVSRFDWKGAGEAVETGFKTYDQYQRAQYVQGYDVYGNPIYRQQ